MTTVAFHGKNCFSHQVGKREVFARTACLVLQYQETDGSYYTLMMEGEKTKEELEMPGGKVEVVDEDIYDTCFRETWEEVILGDVFPLKGNWHLADWPVIRQEILNSNEKAQTLVSNIYSKLRNSPNVIYGTCPLKTIYFVVTIERKDALWLIDNHNLIPVSIDLLKSLVDNQMDRKKTYIHTRKGDYRVRGRDYDGLRDYGTSLG